jgi:predicted small lipoprotein YifL
VLHPRINSATLAGALVIAVSLALGGCGRRGALEPPEGARPAAASPASPARIAPLGARTSRGDPAGQDALFPGAGREPAAADEQITPPDRPFILDAIL